MVKSQAQLLSQKRSSRLVIWRKENNLSKETRSLLPRVRNLNNPKTSLISARDAERNTFKLAMVNDKKMSEDGNPIG